MGTLGNICGENIRHRQQHRLHRHLCISREKCYLSTSIKARARAGFSQHYDLDRITDQWITFNNSVLKEKA